MTASRRTIGALALALLVGLAAPAPGTAAPGEIAGAPLVYLRTGPGPTHQPLGVLSEGTALETLGVDGAWTRVRLEDGREGFVYSTFIEEHPEPTPTAVPEASAPSEAAPFAASEGAEAAPPAESGFDEPPPPTPDPFLLEEVARLRTEIDSLKRAVSDELAPAGTGETASSEPAADVDAGLQMGAIALLSLAVGWFLGLSYGRRRSQRSRLRF